MLALLAEKRNFVSSPGRFFGTCRNDGSLFSAGRLPPLQKMAESIQRPAARLSVDDDALAHRGLSRSSSVDNLLAQRLVAHTPAKLVPDSAPTVKPSPESAPTAKPSSESALAQKVLERWTSPEKKRQQQQQHQPQTFEQLHVWLAGLSGWLTGRARSQPDPTGAGAPEDEDRVLSSVEHILADIRSRKTPARRSPAWPSPTTAHAQTAREFSSSTALVALDDDAITPVRRWTIAGRHVGEVLKGSRTERVYFNDDGSIYYTNHYPIKPELPEYQVLEQGASAAEPGKVIAPKIKHGPRVGFANDYPHATSLIELDPHNTWYKGSPRGPLGLKFSGTSEGAGLLEDHATGLAIVEAASATGGSGGYLTVDSHGFVVDRRMAGSVMMLTPSAPYGTSTGAVSIFEVEREAARAARRAERAAKEAHDLLLTQLLEQVVAELAAEILLDEYVLVLEHVRAHNVPCADLVSGSDPYLVVSLLGCEHLDLSGRSPPAGVVIASASAEGSSSHRSDKASTPKGGKKGAQGGA